MPGLDRLHIHPRLLSHSRPDPSRELSVNIGHLTEVLGVGSGVAGLKSAVLGFPTIGDDRGVKSHKGAGGGQGVTCKRVSLFELS